MRAVRLEAVGKLVLREVAKPDPGPGDILIRVLAAGLCGSDRHMFRGEYPTGTPVTLGHEFCGVVQAVGEAASRIAVDDLVTVDPNIACGTCPACRAARPNLCANLTAIGVFRDGGFADHVVVPEPQAHVLPAGLDPLHGAFSEPLACCLHAMDNAALRPGASVAVLGGGVIGLLMVQLARLAGATTILLSTRQKARRDLALTMGATAVIDPATENSVAALRSLRPDGVDVVIECAGVPETVRDGIGMLRRGGRLVLFGVTPAGVDVPIRPFDLLVNEIQIVPAYLNPHTHARAAAIVAAGMLDLDALVTHRVALGDLPDLIAAAPRPGEIKVIALP